MERTTPINGNKPLQMQEIVTLSTLVNRLGLGSMLGIQSYNGDRNLYEALGYKTELEFSDFYGRYKRQEIAKAVIDRPVKATWQGVLELTETNKPEETEFEKTWRKLDRELGLKTRLARLDRLTGLGRYGILLLGFDNGGSFEQPLVKKPKMNLKYVRPFSEESAKIIKYEDRINNPRYGQPVVYHVEVGDYVTKATKIVPVHYTHVIHAVDGALESDVYGTPRLEAIFNRLMDLEKLVGGDAEMFWRGARPGYHGKLDPEYSATKEFQDKLKSEIEEFEHNLKRILVMEGVDLKNLAQQIADPATHVDAQLKMLSAETGIPMRILSGSERGQLASSEDRSEWMSYVQTRREEFAEPCIVRPFVDKLIEFGLLPEPEDDYKVEWSDLFAQSEVLRVEVGQKRSNAIREYTTNPMAMEIIPPSAFMEACLGLTTDQIELIKAIRDDEMEEEVRKMGEVQKILAPVPPAGGIGNNPPAKDTEKSKEQTGVSKKPRKMPSATV